ncbi:hypothetical protein DESC_120119 [Desulfosarcina cetonica]|nr:hypothetical protein DESC_120119 [Desulfosarcina cetonica]
MIPLRLVLGMEDENAGGRVTAATSQFAVNGTWNRMGGEFLQQCKTEVEMVQDSRYLPAVIGIAEPDACFAGFQLIVEILNAGQAAPVNIAPGLHHAGMVFETDPESAGCAAGNLFQVNRLLVSVHGCWVRLQG